MDPAATDATDATEAGPEAPPVDRAEIAERWTSTVVLGDGTSAVIRPIEPSDAEALAAFHGDQSSESRYLRYFSPKPELTPTELERFTDVDWVDRAAFVVEERGDFVAWASYERWQNRGDAEVAFQVDDEHQGQGIATLLLEHLAAVARQNGITRFTAQTLGDNRGMLAVFAKAGWPVHRRFESGVIDVDFPLADTSEFIDSVERREQRADSRAVARLLLPTSIAVVGASDTPGSVGEALWRHATSDPLCPVYPVNPGHDRIGGERAYASVTDIPEEVGLALVAVPASAVRATIDACIEKRVRGAVVVTAIDEAGIDVEELVAHARRNGLRLIGPASMGVASPRPDVAIQAALVDVRLPPGRVAISMQSGTLGSSLLRLAGVLHLGVSWFVSLGDKSDISANDLLQFWEDDDATAVIALYTESFGNPRKFARIARRVSRTRPIVAVRTGAAMVGTGNAALYRQTGVIEVPTVAALLDTARVFATQPLPAGSRVTVVSNSRSPEVLAAATLAEGGLDVVAPPVRLDWRSAAEHFETAVAAALADDGIDMVLVVHAPPVVGAVGEPIEAIERASADADKPVVAVMLGSGDGPLRRGSSIPSFAFPEQAAAVLGRVAAYARWRATELEHDEEPPSRIDPAAASELITEHVADGHMTPEALRRLLAMYDVHMPPTQLVPADDAVAAAEEVGFPVAVKAIHRRVGRSVEAGVALDLGDADDVADAVRTMVEHLGDDAARVHVQPMVPPGLDFRVHATVEERIGPVLTVGLGGVQADLIGDEVSRLAPIQQSGARALVQATRAGQALDEDEIELVADAIVRIGQLVSDHTEIAELDVNPVIVADEQCWVVDATISLREPAHGAGAVRRLEGS